MPRKNTMRDNVNAIRSRLPHLTDLSREKIELALLYYESNVDETVDAFNRNGAIEALSGWTEMNNGRGNSSAKRINNKPPTLMTNSSVQIPPSNGILRPSQRVSNIFQTFAEGGIPITTKNENTTTISSPSDNNLNHDSITITDDVVTDQPKPQRRKSVKSRNGSTTISSPSDNNLNYDSVTTINDVVIDQPKPQRQKSVQSRNGSTTISSPSDNNLNHDSVTTTNDVIIDQPKPQRRKSIKSRHGSTTTQNHEPSTTMVTKSSLSNNKKLFTKSVKDLQRQTSTLTNVELLFNNEIKSSIKRIDDVFKQLREIIKEREIELYLQMDTVKEQGLNVIHRRQQRAIELRQRIDRCDRLESFEIDNLRSDIKQFVTDRRYELGEELTSSHRFEYDQPLIESLKNFGHVLKIDRRSSITTTSNIPIEQSISDVTTPENIQISITPSVSNEIVVSDNNEVFYENNTGDNPQNFYSLPKTNGYLQYYNDTNNYQNVHRRQPQQYFQRPRPLLNYQNGNNRRNISKQINGRVNISNNNETTNTYRRPRPPPQPSQSIVPVQT